MHGVSIGSLVLIAAIALLLFGGNRLKSLGKDLSGAIRDFRQGLQEDDKSKDKSTKEEL